MSNIQCDSTLTNWAVGEVVHLHRDGKILQVVKELEEGPEFLKADSLQRDKSDKTPPSLWHVKLVKCDVRNDEARSPACVDTPAEGSATILTTHNPLPFILRPYPLVCAGTLKPTDR